MDIPAVAAQAEAQALRNLALSRDAELQYAPENAALRTGSVNNLLLALQNGNNTSPELQSFLASRIANPSATTQPAAMSGVLGDAVARARSDLALGGAVPLDVRNLVARTAGANAGRNFGNLGLARDITARDLGLTSLDLSQRRLNNATTLGNAEQGLINFNTNLSEQGRQFNVGTELNQLGLLQSLTNGDFARALSAAQFGQSLQAPVVGLDPSAIANLAVGNQNAQTSASMTAAQLAASQAQGASQLAGGLIGAGLGGLTNYYGSRQPVVATGGTYQPPLGGNTASAAYVRGGY